MLDAQDHLYLQENFVTKAEFNDFKIEIGEMFTDMAEQLTEQLSAKFSTELRYTEMRIMSIVLTHIDEEKEYRKEIDWKFNHIMESIDRVMIPISDLQQEFAFAKGQHERQIEWNHKVAAKIDVPFDY